MPQMFWKYETGRARYSIIIGMHIFVLISLLVRYDLKAKILALRLRFSLSRIR